MAADRLAPKASLVARTTTGEQVAEALREQIMAGEMPPGSALREVALAEEFGVSRRTLQDALTVLASEGLVRHERHRGSKVAELSRGDVADLYRVRMTLEVTAARAKAAFSDAARSRLSHAFDALDQATVAGDAAEIVLRDLEFHRAVVGLLESPRIDAFFSAIAVEMRYALTILESSYQESRERPGDALDEHRAIKNALLDGQLGTAERLIAEHVVVNRDRLLAVVDDRG
jgi:DNA-binding GntR family transcriptional regulator